MSNDETRFRYDPEGANINVVDNVIVCVRDSDYSNTYAGWLNSDGGGITRAYVHTIDNGYADLTDRDEFLEWAGSHADEAQRLREAGWEDAAKYIESTIMAYDHEGYLKTPDDE